MLDQLEQHAINRLRMNKRYQTTTGAHARCFVNQPCPLVLQLSERSIDVSDFDCDVVHPRTAPREKLSNSRFRAQRLEQLHVGVSNRQHTYLNALLCDLFGRMHFEAECIPPDCQTLFDAVSGDTDVINFEQSE
jgi:hypothetical protein